MNRSSRRYSHVELGSRRPAPYSDDGGFDEIDHNDPVTFTDRDVQQLDQLENYVSELERSASGGGGGGGGSSLAMESDETEWDGVGSPAQAPQAVDGSLTRVVVPDFLG